jgi:TolB-like protein/DNA-binding winged helix-turn-helix (wHTH) protein/cytochrome c-type biogenesis protein CcmH/NrfG
MTARDAHPAAQVQPNRLRFDRYVLDLGRGSLLRDGIEVALRPKTFAVLSCLVENYGRLVSKDEIFAAVWPNLAVTDDTLVQSIGELRRELGDDGPRLIKTIPRRGYRFDAAVMVVVASDPSITDSTPLPTPLHVGVQSSKPVFREAGTFARTAFAGRRRGFFAVLGVMILVAAGALLIDRSARKLPGRSHSSSQISKVVEVGARPTIAILPFVNQSNDPAREYFADGLTQDIINALGRFSALTVMSWNAVSPYKNQPASPGQIAVSLAVRYQLEGNVLSTGDRVRVSAQLVDADGRVLWSARFDHALVDLFALQDKITTQIAGTLAIRVAQMEQQRVLGKPTESLAAYDFVLRARPALQHPGRANIAEARVLLRRAIDLDPNYAAAYSALAETYLIATVMGWAESSSETLSRAQELAKKALSLDEANVRAHTILGRIHIFRQQYEQAKADMDRAIAINPNDGDGLAGRGNVLMWMGETDAAIKALEMARRIDPELNVIDRNALSLAYYVTGRYKAAIEEAELNLRRSQGANFSRVVLAAAYAQDNRVEDVARVVTAIRRLDPTFDPREFGTKFLKPADLERLRDGLRKADLFPREVDPRSDR